MQLPTIPKIGRLSKKHKITAAGAAAAAAVVLAVTGLQATGGTAEAKGDPTGFSVDSGQQVMSLDAQASLASQKAIQDDAAAKKKAADTAAAQQKAAADAAAKKKAADAAAAREKAAHAAAQKKAAQKKAAQKKRAAAQAAARAKAKQAATRSTHRVALKAVPKKVAAAPAAVVYPDNLDGWIREARAVLAAHDIPVPTYDGIYRNIIRESSGNPNAINLWDINAQNGIPSKGLLQTIDPTFNAYHVSGTSWNVYNPVANIAAACNYAWHVYGGMDNVNSAY
jgi:flagellar biosynthesis GTPase FlhF